jgi:hypothetical protein
MSGHGAADMIAQLKDDANDPRLSQLCHLLVLSIQSVNLVADLIFSAILHVERPLYLLRKYVVKI